MAGVPRVSVLNPDFTVGSVPDPVAVMQLRVNSVAQALEANPALARGVLKNGDLVQFFDPTSRTYAATYGKAIEKLTAQSLKETPLSNSMFQYVAGPGEPDWVGARGAFSQDFMFDEDLEDSMQLFENKTFENLADHTGTAKFSDAEFRRCTFRNCVLTSPGAVTQRPLIRNVHLQDCADFGSHLAKAVLEEVVVDGLRTRDLFIFSACAFRHVALKGKIGEIKVTDLLPGVGNPPKLQSAFDAANLAYYQGVDWALDISQAEFEDFDLTGVPLSLIRRDPETQVVLPSHVTSSQAWRNVPDFAKTWGPIVSMLLKLGLGPELLLVAPKRNAQFREQLAGFNALRRAGLIQ